MCIECCGCSTLGEMVLYAISNAELSFIGGRPFEGGAESIATDVEEEGGAADVVVVEEAARGMASLLLSEGGSAGLNCCCVGILDSV